MAQSRAMAPAAQLAVRLALAVVFMAHGAHWLFGTFAGSGIGPGGVVATTAFYAAAGISPAFLFTVIGGSAQLAGGLLTGAGLFTRSAAVTLAVVELVKVWFDSARWGFFLNWAGDPTRGQGMEYSFLVLCMLAAVLVSGGGDWSVDGWRQRTSNARVAGLARIRDRG